MKEKDTILARAPLARRSARLLAAAALVLASAVQAVSAQGGFGSATDPRAGLRGGLKNAASAIKGLTLLSNSPKADTLNIAPLGGLTYANSDLAFRGNYVFQGNFSGFQIWNVANPRHPVLRKAFVCATDQGDPSIWGNLLFLSAESTRGRTDCGIQGVEDTVSKERARGVRIFDISDIEHPKHIIDVQTCRGSHTHTIVPDPKDKSVIYIYVSGSAGVRSPDELAGCSAGTTEENPNTAQFRIEVIRVPLAHPEQSAIESSPRIFENLAAVQGHGNPAGDTTPPRQRGGRGDRGGRGGGGAGAAGGGGRADVATAPGAAPAAPTPPTGPTQCHDITVYPSIGLAGGACGGYGLLLDIKDPAHPTRLAAAADSNFAFWHSATFNNAGTTVLFTDEWGGGQQPKCRSIDPLNWGGDAIFTIENGKLTQGAYFKMPAVQTSQENCVAHNGSLVPVPGRDIMVQGWYQGGIDVFDFTDVQHPVEIAYFDRGPIDSTKIITGGEWAGYWYNGHIYASEIVRGLDIFDLKPTDMLSQNEIDAAKLVKWDQFNPQSQPKIVWPAAFPVVRSYLDQLVRGKGLPAARTTALKASLSAAEKLTGAARRGALNKVATSLDADVSNATDSARVRAMAAAVRDLANATK